MKDPWRVVDPIREEQEKRRIHPSEIDFDASLRPELSCVLRFKACALEVHSRDLQTPRDALEAVAMMIIDLKKAKVDLYYAFAQHGKIMALPPNGFRTARLECGDVTVWFLERTLDDGMLSLVRDLIKVQRNSKLSPILKRHGVTPILRA